MNKISISKIIATAIFITTALCISGSAESIVEAYHKQYPFISMKDTIYTFHSEFVVPEGYAYMDPSKFTKFQNWIANFPIWHRHKAIGNYIGGKKFEASEVCRGVHLPWTGHNYTDKNFPLRIFGEYFIHENSMLDFYFLPNKGDTLRYKEWLTGDVLYNYRKEVYINPGLTRESSEEEFYSYIHFCMVENSYLTLTKNCTQIEEKNVMPGDLYITWNQNGMKGNVYFVMNVITDSNNNKLIAVATGDAKKACDIYIPKINEDRNNPWITIEKLKELPEEKLNSGFFKFNLTDEN